MKLRLWVSRAAIVIAITSFAHPASAASIVGTMSFTQGGVTLLDSSLTATTIPAATPAAALQFVAGPPAQVSFFGTEGDYIPAIGSAVTFIPSPYLFTDSGPLWTAGIFKFYGVSASSFESDGAFWLYTTGYVHADGFEDSPAVWVLTTQGTRPTVTWTSSVTTVPEPSVIAIALSAIWLGCRRKRANPA